MNVAPSVRMTGSRISDLQNFYALLGCLAERVGGARTLGACSGRLGLPRRGVYFFMEDGEVRSDSGSGPASCVSEHMP
jgi:hypothetical protein